MYYRPGPLVQAYYCYNIVKLSRFGPQVVYNLRVSKELNMSYRRMSRGEAYFLFPILIAPFVFLFQLVLFLAKVLIFLMPIVLISLVVFFIGLTIVQKVNNALTNKQLKVNTKRNKDLGPVAPNRNNINVFCNTATCKKAQAANKMSPIKQYASY